MIQYEIEVKTGVLKGAGTDHEIKLEIIGSKDKTRLRSLDHICVNDFESNQTDKFTKTDVDVGSIEYIGLSVKPKLVEDPWYVETIKIGRRMKGEDGGDDDGDDGIIDKIREIIDRIEGEIIEEDKGSKEVIIWTTFPIYSWIMPNKELQYFFTNKTSIPQKESTTRKLGKVRSQQTMKDSVEWVTSENKLKQFPGYININSPGKLNLNLKFTDDKDRDFASNRRKVLRNAAFGGVRNNFKDFYKFEHYERAAKQLRCPLGCPWLENELWKKDEEFGRQILNGINPAMIERCTAIPENFLVNNSTVSDSLTRGLTLEEEMEQGNIYIINLAVLKDISTGHFPFGSSSAKGRKLELAVPICLLYNGSDDKLRPIAIQLGQEPGPKFPIWTPKDEENDWLLAKIWFRNADYQIHQMRCHLAFTHLLVEPIAVATFRCLPAAHPVHKVLKDHLHFVIAINVIGRARLICKVF